MITCWGLSDPHHGQPEQVQVCAVHSQCGLQVVLGCANLLVVGQAQAAHGVGGASRQLPAVPELMPPAWPCLYLKVLALITSVLNCILESECLFLLRYVPAPPCSKTTLPCRHIQLPWDQRGCWSPQGHSQWHWKGYSGTWWVVKGKCHTHIQEGGSREIPTWQSDFSPRS